MKNSDRIARDKSQDCAERRDTEKKRPDVGIRGQVARIRHERRIETQYPADSRRVLVEDLVELPACFGGVLIQPDDLGLRGGGLNLRCRRLGAGHPGLGVRDGRERKPRAKANGGNCRPKTCVDHVENSSSHAYYAVAQGRLTSSCSDPAKPLPKEVLLPPSQTRMNPSRPTCAPGTIRVLCRVRTRSASSTLGKSEPYRNRSDRPRFRLAPRQPAVRDPATHSRVIARLRRRISRVLA